jgi:uncharacterized lipoprotein YmbA
MPEPGFIPPSIPAGHRLRGHSRGRAPLALAVLAVLLIGCAGTSPALQSVRLPSAVPGLAAGAGTAVVAQAAPASPSASPALNWQLMSPVQLPDYLDRDALLVPRGQAGLQPLPGYRWAEPLRESVSRLLRLDLGALRGDASVWRAPLPAGLRIERQLRVELLSFESNTDRSAVTLQARWSLADPVGGVAPQVQSARLTVPVAGSDIDALAAAHRLALWRLAERIAGAAAAP